VEAQRSRHQGETAGPGRRRHGAAVPRAATQPAFAQNPDGFFLIAAVVIAFTAFAGWIVFRRRD